MLHIHAIKLYNKMLLTNWHHVEDQNYQEFHPLHPGRQSFMHNVISHPLIIKHSNNKNLHPGRLALYFRLHEEISNIHLLYFTFIALFESRMSSTGSLHALRHFNVFHLSVCHRNSIYCSFFLHYFHCTRLNLKGVQT